MPSREMSEPQGRALTQLSQSQRERAMARFAVLQPHLEEGASLAQAARAAGVALRTAERWLSRYRASGLIGLARTPRTDSGRPKIAEELVDLIEGLFLKKPRPPVTAIHRRITAIARERQLPIPAYSSVHAIVSALDPGLVTLAHEGHAAYRDQFELIYRHRAERPNATWQADHTQLDLLILDADGQPKRPWLTTVIDDYSRIVAGYTVFLGAPSTLQTCLALRQAIWRKEDPAWPVCGIPEVLYVDHGCDFTSRHLEQVAADLKIQLVHSAVARPQGRGKVERLFGTLNTELLCDLPGYLVEGKPATAPKLSLSALDAEIGAHIIGNYNVREHQEIDAIPRIAWLGQGWVPRVPQSLEALDLLLIAVATARVVRRDGIHFEGLRYLDATLAAYVGESVTVRYDPRDVAEIRVFHHDRFLCRAINQQHSDQTLSLKDIQAARAARRRQLRGQISERVTGIGDSWKLDKKGPPSHFASEKPAAAVRKPTLRLYLEDT
ncbi:MAG: Mu transposase C-terminal domain-containing protein [Acetobacteraceae bacterium]